MADLSERIVVAVAGADRANRWPVVRALLATVAAYTIAVSVVTLVVADDSGSIHGARHIAAFTLAYGAGLVMVAIRPARARAMLPVAGTLGLALVIAAVVDVVDSRASLLGEALHLPELLSLLLVWLLAGPALHGRPRGGVRRDGRSPALRLVDEQYSSRQDVPSASAH